ncbi:MAG: ABC transporter ATP-binding protein [Firmicutes bacterium]|nr:ABC transporter ATP-binding protein [Bacillota bacterium]
MQKRGLLIGGLFVIFLAELISLGYAWTRANLLDQAIIGKKSIWLLYATLLYFGITVFYVLLQLGSTAIFTALGQDHIIKWRSALVNALVNDPTVPKESVQSMFAREAVSSGTLFSTLLPQAASRLFSAVLPFVLLLRIQPQAALISLLAIPLLLLCQKHLNRWAKLLESRVLDYGKRLSSYVVETVRGLSVVQLYGATDWMRKRASSIQAPFWRRHSRAPADDSPVCKRSWDTSFGY